MSESFNTAIKIGQEGIQLFYKENYGEAKDKCVEACRILQKFKNQGSQNTKSLLKGYMLQFLTIAETASQKLGNNQRYKNQDKENNIFIQQIEANMITTANTSFNDIIGLDNVKQIIKQSIVHPNMRPDLYKGIRSPPRGILFYGPPGNGKTLMAKAVATECNSTFFNVTAASLMSKWVGESQKMLKCIFAEAYRRQPSIIFFDEIDAILSSRSENQNDSSRRLKTQFLVQLDGVSTTDKDRVLLIAATNLPNELDKAALRRFTKKILIDLPDVKAKKHMISKDLKTVKSQVTEYEIEEIANKLQLYSGADVKNLIREAVMMPFRELSYQQILMIDKNALRAVNKSDFLKALQVSPPTLNREQYMQYKRFGDQDNSTSTKQTYIPTTRQITQAKQPLDPNTNKIDPITRTAEQAKRIPVTIYPNHYIQPQRLKVQIIRFQRDPVTNALVRRAYSPGGTPC